MKFFSNIKILMAFVGSLLLLSASCNRNNSDAADIRIARVNSKYLYKSDLVGLVPDGTSSADSTTIVKRFIDNWVRQQVFLSHAEKNISVDVKSFEKKIDDYRSSLVLFAYESQLVRQKLDTNVTDKQIKDYYEKNQSDFRLKENIVKVSYFKLLPDAPQQDVVRRLIRSTEQKDLATLEEYGSQNAVNYFIGGDYWILFNDLLRDIPIQTGNYEQFLRNNKYYETRDENYRYYLAIHDFRTKENISPVSFEKDNIKSIILNQRRHELITKMRNDLFKEAAANGSFEVFL